MKNLEKNIEERIEFATFNEFLEQASRVQKMYSRDGKTFWKDYDEMQDFYGGDILLPESALRSNRTYYIIKAQ